MDRISRSEPCVVEQGLDVGEVWVVVELEDSQAGEPAQHADVTDPITAEVEGRQAREPAQRANVGDRVVAAADAARGTHADGAKDEGRQARESAQHADVGDRVVAKDEVRQAREPAQCADVRDRVAGEFEERQAREPAQCADVADRVVGEVEERQAREPTQRADVNDPLAKPVASEVEDGQPREILDPDQALDANYIGRQDRHPGYQATGEILLRTDHERTPNVCLQDRILERRDGVVRLIAA